MNYWGIRTRKQRRHLPLAMQLMLREVVRQEVYSVAMFNLRERHNKLCIFTNNIKHSVPSVFSMGAA